MFWQQFLQLFWECMSNNGQTSEEQDIHDWWVIDCLLVSMLWEPLIVELSAQFDNMFNQADGFLNNAGVFDEIGFSLFTKLTL